MGGLATLYLIVVLLICGITLPLLMAYVYSSNRTVAGICYAAALTIAFPGVACIGNSSSIPPDYVGGFLELVTMPLEAFEPDIDNLGHRIITFFAWVPIPSLVALVVAAPFLRTKLVARRGRRSKRSTPRSHPAK